MLCRPLRLWPTTRPRRQRTPTRLTFNRETITSMTTVAAAELFMALELRKRNWKLAFSNGVKVRQVNVPAGDFAGLVEQIARAKARLGLPAETPVRSVYEAGRDGFWIERRLGELGVANLVVDAASIEVNRRQRRAKTDRLDAGRLVRMWMRYHGGEQTLGRVGRVPSPEPEEARRWHRELERLKKERTAQRARRLSLESWHGVAGQLSQRLWKPPVRDWPGLRLPAAVAEGLERERPRLRLVDAQIAALEKRQEPALASPQTEAQR